MIFDILTGEEIPRIEYGTMVKAEKIARVQDFNKEKKEIRCVVAGPYGYVRKKNLDNITDVTAIWKDCLFAEESSMDGSLFSIKFAVRNIDASQMISIATKMFASVLKISDGVVWFQTGIHGSLNSLSKNVRKLQHDGLDVFDVSILVFDENRELLQHIHTDLEHVIEKIALLRGYSSNILKPMCDGQEMTAGPEETEESDVKRLDDFQNIDSITQIDGNVENKSFEKSLNSDWRAIRNRLPDEVERIINYKELLLEELENCRGACDREASYDIDSGKYDDAQELLKISKMLKKCCIDIEKCFE